MRGVLMDKDNKDLNYVIAKVDEFKDKNADILRENIQDEIMSYKSTLTNDGFLKDMDAQINQEMNNKLIDFKEGIDLKSKALYYDLKSKLELNNNVSEQELTLSAYDFLEKNTKNKFFKKILKELKKETKK